MSRHRAILSTPRGEYRPGDVVEERMVVVAVVWDPLTERDKVVLAGPYLPEVADGFIPPAYTDLDEVMNLVLEAEKLAATGESDWANLVGADWNIVVTRDVSDSVGDHWDGPSTMIYGDTQAKVTITGYAKESADLDKLHQAYKTGQFMSGVIQVRVGE